MSANLATGVFTRWNDASLDTSVDTLYWGETAPEGDTLPRAVYNLTADDSQGLSRGSLIHLTRLRVQTWDETMELVSGYNDSIKAVFHNADKAVTSPLSMSGANITHCLYRTATVVQEDEGVYMGVIEFEIQWQETNAIPG